MRATFPIYIDGRRVDTVRVGDSTTLVLSDGRHSIFIRAECWTSDIIELDLQRGEHVQLISAFKTLMHGRFFGAIERKVLYFVMPLALIAYASKDVVHFIERHLKVEFLAVTFLFCLGVFLNLPRLFSRRPGAMLSLEWENPPADGTRGGGAGEEAFPDCSDL